MVGSGYEADQSGHEEHDSLRRVLRIGDGEGAHHKEARAHDQQCEGGQHGAPVLAHFGMPPAVCVGLLRGQVAVLLDERIAVPGGCVLGVLVVAPREREEMGSQLKGRAFNSLGGCIIKAGFQHRWLDPLISKGFLQKHALTAFDFHGSTLLYDKL